MRKRYLVMTVLLAVILSIGGYGLLMNVKNDKAVQPNESHSPIDFQYNSKPEYYTEKYRTQYHLSPEAGNMSDPNGMVLFEGEYHQFYQNQGRWGHAVSKDLLHWDHLPLALKGDMLGDIWSGSAVVDWKDSSGFFNGKPGLVAIFTHFKDGLQSQSIAYSLDKGRNWTKYEGNPVIPNPDLKDFRDPKVIWFEPTQQWVMVVSIDQKIRFYTSSNLKEWTMRSDFGEGQGSHAAVWECPDLFELPVEGTDKKKWVLMVSIGNNLSTDGSTAQYFIGDFDGVKFVNENEPSTTLWVDYGKDFYAAVSYSDIPKVDGRRIWLGWMSNWKYPFDMPTWSWRGNMSIPREVTLRKIPDEGIRLIQKPIVELESLRGKSIHLANKKVESDNKALEDIQGTSYEIRAEFELGSAKKFGFKVLVGKDQETRIYYDVEANKVMVDRSKAGVTDFTNSFTGLFEGHLKPKKGKISLNIFVDVSTIELFANDGELVFTNLVFPDPASNGLELFAEGGSVDMKTFDYFPMQSVWRKK